MLFVYILLLRIEALDIFKERSVIRMYVVSLVEDLITSNLEWRLGTSLYLIIENIIFWNVTRNRNVCK